MEPAQKRKNGISFSHGLRGWLALILPLFLCAHAMAQDADRGRQLFENQCQACHKDMSKPGKKHEVGNLKDLRQRIQGWALHMGENWGDSEVDDVLLYLNSTVYRFKELGAE